MENQTQPPTINPVPQNPQAIPPAPPPAPYKPTLLLIFLIIFVVIAVASVGYLAWQNQQLTRLLAGKNQTNTAYIDGIIPTPNQKVIPTKADETAAWKIYTDTTNKFSLKYPEGVKITKQSTGPSNTIKFTLIGPTQMASGRTETELTDGYQVTIITSPLVQAYDLTAAAEKGRRGTLNVDYGPACKVSPVTSGTIDGIATAEYMTTNCLGNARVIEAIANGLAYEITGGYSAEGDYANKIDQILSTFKFTNSATDVTDMDALTVAKKYLDAYVVGDWAMAKENGDPQMDERIAAGYGFTKYEITGSKAEPDPNQYHVYVKFTDKKGQVWDIAPHTQSDPLQVLMMKNNGVWKAVTWYFYE